jgi:hypothetical protein
MDMAQIAGHLGGLAEGWSEALVYNQIADEKKEERALSASRPLVRYAGHDRLTKAWGGR